MWQIITYFIFINQASIIIAKLSPSPSFIPAGGWGGYISSFSSPAGRPSRIVLSGNNTALKPKLKMYNLTSRTQTHKCIMTLPDQPRGHLAHWVSRQMQNKKNDKIQIGQNAKIPNINNPKYSIFGVPIKINALREEVCFIMLLDCLCLVFFAP